MGSGGVLVVMEQRGAGWHRISLEALAAGQRLAAELGVGCSAAVVGEGAEAWSLEGGGTPISKSERSGAPAEERSLEGGGTPISKSERSGAPTEEWFLEGGGTPISKSERSGAPEAGAPEALAAKRLETVWLVTHPLLASYSADGWTAALQQLIAEARPEYVVFPHTYQVRDYAPKLAARLGQVLLGDVTAILTDSQGPVFVRQWMQGKLNAEYRHGGEGVCLVSVQAGFKGRDQISEIRDPGAAEVREFVPAIGAGAIRTKAGEPFREAARTVDLSAAQVIVGVGRGIGAQENLALVEELAAAMGAEIAASRPICDAGWLPMERQVGSSGQTVAPKVYLAIGISGAIQHLVGMKGAKTVIAINKDEAAPIFEVADVGVVGDLFEIVPALTKAVKAEGRG